MRIKRRESWGTIYYRLDTHDFYATSCDPAKPVPYVSQPLVLNIDLTFKCNMNCTYCVAKDTERTIGMACDTDLLITPQLVDWLNNSPFLLLVITGGEPFLPQLEDRLLLLLKSLRGKGIVIDTNGTITPSARVLTLLKRKHALVRVSWDNPDPSKETYFRRYGKLFSGDNEYLTAKLRVIHELTFRGIAVAVQSVVHGQNFRDRNFHKLPYFLDKLGIRKWYLQRIIPSNKMLNDSSSRRRRLLDFADYMVSVNTAARYADRVGVQCIYKSDRRHNSVFLLVGDGKLYTQSDRLAGQKILLGMYHEITDYFAYVSAADHSSRYYAGES